MTTIHHARARWRCWNVPIMSLLSCFSLYEHCLLSNLHIKLRVLIRACSLHGCARQSSSTILSCKHIINCTRETLITSFAPCTSFSSARLRLLWRTPPSQSSFIINRIHHAHDRHALFGLDPYWTARFVRWCTRLCGPHARDEGLELVAVGGPWGRRSAEREECERTRQVSARAS